MQQLPAARVRIIARPPRTASSRSLHKMKRGLGECRAEEELPADPRVSKAGHWGAAKIA